MPRFWYDGTELDSRLINALSHPQGLVYEMEKSIGIYPNGLDLTPDGDYRRFLGAMWLLENKLADHEKPFFLTAYFASYDEAAHQFGAFSSEALNTLRAIDDHIGKLCKRAAEIAGENLIICLVSDHGTLDNTHNIKPNVILREHGLITSENGKLTGWQAYCHRSGGTAEVRLHNPGDKDIREKTEAALRTLEQYENSGVAKILTGDEVRKERRGFTLCDFAIIAKPGYEIRDEFEGEYITDKITQRAQHGYDEEYPQMRAFFGICGAEIEPARDLGEARLIDVSPTLSAKMGFKMKDAQGHSLI